MVYLQPIFLFQNTIYYLEEKKEKGEIMNIMRKAFNSIEIIEIKQCDLSVLLDVNTKEIDLYEVEKKLEKYHPYVSIKSIDLRKFKELERIALGKSNMKVMIDGLMKIKELGMKNKKLFQNPYVLIVFFFIKFILFRFFA